MKRTFSYLLGLSLLLASCGQQPTPDPTPNPGPEDPVIEEPVVDIPEGTLGLDLLKDTTRDMPVNAVLDYTYSGVIAGQERDYDYYFFDAAEGDRLQINVMSSHLGGSTLDPYVKLYMADGWVLMEKDDDNIYAPGESDLDSEIRFNVPESGRYIIEVTSFKLVNAPEATDDDPSNLYTLKVSERE